MARPMRRRSLLARAMALAGGTSACAMRPDDLAAATPAAVPAGPTKLYAYPVPASISLVLQAHGKSSVRPMITSWPGFARGHLRPDMHLVGRIGTESFPIQQDGEVFWSDGSVRNARIAFRLPGELAADRAVTVTVTPSPGAPDRTSHMTPQQMVAGRDFTLRAFGLDCGDTTFVTSVRDIVTHAPRDAWGANPVAGWDVPIDGPYETMIRAWAYRRDRASGAYHKWIRDTIYLSHSVTGDWEVVARSEQPNWDGPLKNPAATLGGTTQLHCACYLELYDGDTLVHAWGGPHDPRVLHADQRLFSGVRQYDGPGLSAFQGGVFTGPGVPAGLVQGRPYWVGQEQPKPMLYDNRWAISDAQANGIASTINFGSLGVGAVTMTPVVATYYGSSVLLMGDDAWPVRIGQPRVEIGQAWDEKYMSAGARMFPRVDQGFRRVSSAEARFPVYPYFPNQTPYGSWANATGDNPGDERIGYVNHSAALALALPLDAGYCKRARVMAAGYADQAIWWRDPASGRVLVNDNGPDNAGGRYPQMGASRPSVSFNGGDHSWLGNEGGASRAERGPYYDGYSAAPLDGSHCPCPWPMAAYQTGHPAYADMGAFQASALQLWPWPDTRHPVVGKRRFYAQGWLGQQTRGAGWELRVAGYAERFTPAAAPEAAFLRHAIDQLAEWGSAYVDTMSPQNRALGFVPPMNNQMYMNNIWRLAVAFEVWQGERPALRHFLETAMNLTAGLNNDEAQGWSGLAGQEQYLNPVEPVDTAKQHYASMTELVAASVGPKQTHPLHSPVGFLTGQYETPPGGHRSGFPFCSNSYATYTSCVLAICKDLALVTPNGDDCGRIYDALQRRFATRPCTGVNFSDFDYLQGRAHMYPEWAIVPSSS